MPAQIIRIFSRDWPINEAKAELPRAHSYREYVYQTARLLDPEGQRRFVAAKERVNEAQRAVGHLLPDFQPRKGTRL